MCAGYEEEMRSPMREAGHGSEGQTVSDDDGGAEECLWPV